MKTIKDLMFGFIQQFANENELYSQRAEVVSVDIDKNICTVTTIADKSTINRVQLSAFIGASLGVFLIPAVGSIVTLSFYNKDEAFIAKSSELSAIKIFVGDSSIILEEGKITLNNGENGGLINIDDLTTALNGLVTEINNMVTVFNAHTHTAPSGATTPPLTSQSNASDFNASDYTDENVIH